MMERRDKVNYYLDLAEMEIYAGEEIAEVVVNGVETEVVRGRKTLWKRA